MGCGASVNHFPVPDCSSGNIVKKVLRRKVSDSSDDYAITYRQNRTDQQVKALCFANVKSLIFRRETPLPMRVGRRRGPSAQDLKFIEQRVHIESDEEEVDDAATNKTDSTTTTRLTVSSNHTTNKVGDLPQKQTERNEPGEPRSFFKIAMDYNKRMDTIKSFRPKKPDPQPKTIFVKPERKNSLLNEPAAIIQHVTRREFLENASSIKTPPMLVRRVITPTRNSSVHGSRETLMSERSFIVVHNTLRVAWEKEICHEKIQEQKRLQRLKQAHLRWHSVDSSCSGSSESADSPDPAIIFGTNRRDWSRELDEIVRLD